MTTVTGIDARGTQHCETTALGVLLRHQGLDLSEPMLFGLGSGLSLIFWDSKNMGFPFLGGRVKPEAGRTLSEAASALPISASCRRRSLSRCSRRARSGSTAPRKYGSMARSADRCKSSAWPWKSRVGLATSFCSCRQKNSACRTDGASGRLLRITGSCTVWSMRANPEICFFATSRGVDKTRSSCAGGGAPWTWAMTHIVVAFAAFPAGAGRATNSC